MIVLGENQISVTSHVPRTGPRGRTAIPLIVAALGVALGAAGVLLLRSSGALAPVPASSLTGGAGGPGRAGHSGAGSLNAQAVYDRLEPSVVDVTSTLRYDGETASGTGFIINGPDALVLTNNHVIRDATAVTVTLTATGRTYPARVVGADVGADVAVLQIEGAAGAPGAPGLPAAPLGDSATVTPGTPVLAIGNQAGQGGAPAIAPGIIDSLNRTIQAADSTSGFTETLHDMLATSAQIQPGDSGGPLADAAGLVIGMDTAAGTGPGRIAIGYAIPINGAMAVARQIEAGRAAPGITLGVSGFLGVVVAASTSPSPLLQEHEEHGLPADAGSRSRPPGCLDTEAGAGIPAAVAPARWGALVDGVLCGTGAAAAGITAGDVITSAAGHFVSSPDALTAIVSACRPGAVVQVSWISTTGITRTSLIRLVTAPAV